MLALVALKNRNGKYLCDTYFLERERSRNVVPHCLTILADGHFAPDIAAPFLRAKFFSACRVDPEYGPASSQAAARALLLADPRTVLEILLDAPRQVKLHAHDRGWSILPVLQHFVPESLSPRAAALAKLDDLLRLVGEHAIGGNVYSAAWGTIASPLPRVLPGFAREFTEQLRWWRPREATFRALADVVYDMCFLGHLSGAVVTELAQRLPLVLDRRHFAFPPAYINPNGRDACTLRTEMYTDLEWREFHAATVAAAHERWQAKPVILESMKYHWSQIMSSCKDGAELQALIDVEYPGAPLPGTNEPLDAAPLGVNGLGLQMIKVAQAIAVAAAFLIPLAAATAEPATRPRATAAAARPAVAWDEAEPRTMHQDARDNLVSEHQLARVLAATDPELEALPATSLNVNFTVLLANVSVPVVYNKYFPPLSDEVLAQVYDADKVKYNGGLEVWSGMAKSWRTGVRGQEPIPINDLNPTGPKLQKPTVIFTMICFIIGLLTCCCSSCCACCLVYRKPSAISQRRLADGSVNKRFIRIKIVFIVLAFIQLIFVICLAQGNATFSRGLKTTVGAVYSTAQSVYTVVYKVQPVGNGILTGASGAVNVTIDDITAPTTVPTFEANIKAAGDALSSILRSAAGQVAGAKSDLNALSASLNSTSANMTTVKSDLNAAISGVNGLNAQLTVPTTNEGYRLTNQITGIPTAASFNIPDLSSPPNVTSARNQLNALPDLAAQANNVDAQVGSAGNTVRTKLADANKATKGMVQSYVSMARDQLNNMADTKRSNGIAATVTSMLAMATGIIDSQALAVDFYSSILYSVTLMAGLFLIFGFVTVGASLPTLSPQPPRHCGCCSILTASLLFIITFIFFMVASLLGEGCVQLDPAAPATLGGPAVSAMAKTGFATVYTMASTNVSALMALELNNATAAFGIPIASFNLSKLVDSELRKLDLAKQVNDQLNSLNVSALVSWNGGSVADQLAPLTGTTGPLAAFNFTFFSTLPTTISTANLASLRDNLSSLKGSVTTSSFTYDTTVVTAQQKTNCVNDFKSRLDTQIATLNGIITTSAPNAATSLTDTKAKGGNLETRVNQLKTSANTIVTRFNALVGVVTDYLASTRTDITTVRIPKALASLAETAGAVDAALAEHLSFQLVARSILSVTNGMCALMLGGADALWLGCLWAAITALVLMYTYVKIHAYLRSERKTRQSAELAQLIGGKSEAGLSAPVMAKVAAAAASPPVSGKDALKVNPVADTNDEIASTAQLSPGSKV
ncbi:hypothetical protein H9P43_002633 [Blastocladiella emersonii ATCC 22665]|nr:hypothetical protein H9P43_002633 [Blastocladiella emersonii ATCC 22665]